MPGIKVEIKQAKRWWYVVADFGDGSPPVTKGPMTEVDAKTMAANLEAEASKVDGVRLRDRSLDDEAANRRAAYGFLSFASAVILVIIMAAYLANK